MQGKAETDSIARCAVAIGQQPPPRIARETTELEIILFFQVAFESPTLPAHYFQCALHPSYLKYRLCHHIFSYARFRLNFPLAQTPLPPSEMEASGSSGRARPPLHASYEDDQCPERPTTPTDAPSVESSQPPHPSDTPSTPPISVYHSIPSDDDHVEQTEKQEPTEMPAQAFSSHPLSHMHGTEMPPVYVKPHFPQDDKENIPPPGCSPPIPPFWHDDMHTSPDTSKKYLPPVSNRRKRPPRSPLKDITARVLGISNIDNLHLPPAYGRIQRPSSPPSRKRPNARSMR